MKNLDEVILGLENCIKDADSDGCPGCPYGPTDDFSCCVELMKDALEMLTKLRRIREDYECGLIFNNELAEALWGEEGKK